jgi:hypothetical protein
MDEDLDDCRQRCATYVQRFLELSSAYLGLHDAIEPTGGQRAQAAPAEAGSTQIAGRHAPAVHAEAIHAAQADLAPGPPNGVEPWSRSSMSS